MCTLPNVGVAGPGTGRDAKSVSGGRGGQASPDASGGGRSGATGRMSVPQAGNHGESGDSRLQSDAAVEPVADGGVSRAATQAPGGRDAAPSPPPSAAAGRELNDAGSQPDASARGVESLPPEMQVGRPHDAGTDSGAPTMPELPGEPPSDVSQDEFAAWPMPSAAPGSLQAPDYSVEENTVTDNVTKLVWQRRVPTNYPGCSGSSGTTCTWQEAQAYCRRADTAAALGGSGWRLPNRIELVSLIDETRANPAIETSVFPDVAVLAFWSSSVAFDFPNQYAWYVYFGDGSSNNWQFSDTYAVRCVR